MAAKSWSLTTPADDILKNAVPASIRDVKEHAFTGAGFYVEAQDTPDDTIAIYEGVVYFGTTRVDYEGLDIVDLGTGGAFETTAMTADYYNKILFTINSSGTLTATEGTANAVLGSVTEPTLPEGEFPICLVSVQDDGTGTAGTILTIEQSEIMQLQGMNTIPSGIIPSGGIIMWSGAISAIPTGWVLCDGSSGTPDLTDRFVIHADADSGGTNDVGDTGGSNTIAEAQLPSHTHGVGTLATDDPGDHTHTYSSQDGGGYGYPEGTAGPGSYKNTSSSGAHTHTISGSSASTGSGNDYKPKYYALAYIMKS